MLGQNTQAIVINRYPFGEGDFVVNLFTRDLGRVKTLAKGVRKPQSRRGGHIDLFNVIECQLRSGKGEMTYLTEARALETFELAKASTDKLPYLYYFAELLNTFFFEEEETMMVFNRVVEGFRYIERLPEGRTAELETLARRFEIFLLRHFGFWSDEVHGQESGADMASQREHNQNLIREVSHTDLKSQRYLHVFKDKKLV